ncbi:MAG: CBS domain-containing protein [Steroidobacteraceae bacterium]|jgi:CBS domain-containing protein
MQGASLAAVSLMPMSRFGGAALPRRSVLDGRSIEPGDPAVHALTDFTREFPVTVDPERQIDDALNDMIHLGVRALLVAKDQRLVGLVTSYDIQGEKPIQFLHSSNYNRHEEIRVAHIMTPLEELHALDWRSMESARAGDLLEIFEATGLTHLLVIELDRNGSTAVVRGLASRARLVRQLKGRRRAG